MRGRIAICTTSLIPPSGGPTGAHGLRASGLWEGLSATGFDAEIVSPASNIKAQRDRWGAGRIAIPAHWRILPDNAYAQHLNGDYDVVIFPNWPVARGFKKAGDTRVVYDFFSATMVEHAALFTAEVLAKKAAEKLALLSQADLIIANGGVQAAYAATFVENIGLGPFKQPIPAVRLGVPCVAKGAAPPPHGPLRLFVGGYQQAWTTGLSLDALDRLAQKHDGQIHIVGLGEHAHFTELSRTGGQRDAGGRLVHHEVGSFQSFVSANARCHLTLDVFARNEERELSYSTRAITSLAAGCPVITMGFTEIGQRITQTGAGFTLDTPAFEALDALLHRLAADRDAISAAREATAAFWARFIDPAVQIAPLVTLLDTAGIHAPTA